MLRPVVQMAYHVPSLERAAVDAAARFGWGPFFIAEHVALRHCRYRGRESVFFHSCAYGQAGDIMVELLMQHDPAPSAVRELYDPHETGLHHMASFTQDLARDIARYELEGRVAMDMTSAEGLRCAYIDLRDQTGHYLELCEPSRPLTDFYGFIRAAASGWDGRDPVRML